MGAYITPNDKAILLRKQKSADIALGTRTCKAEANTLQKIEMFYLNCSPRRWMCLFVRYELTLELSLCAVHTRPRAVRGVSVLYPIIRNGRNACTLFQCAIALLQLFLRLRLGGQCQLLIPHRPNIISGTRWLRTFEVISFIYVKSFEVATFLL